MIYAIFIYFLPSTDASDICTSKVPFQIHGPHGILHHLKYLIQTKGSAVVCVAEGAGQVSRNHNFKSCFIL